jgi:hypothetical protein
MAPTNDFSDGGHDIADVKTRRRVLARHVAIGKTTVMKTRLFKIAFKKATAAGNTKKSARQANRRARALESVLAQSQSTSLSEIIARIDYESDLILSKLRRLPLSMRLNIPNKAVKL